MLRVTLTLFVTFWVLPSLACSPASSGRDKRIAVEPSCAFTHAGKGEWGIGAGREATDHGAAIVSQVYEFGPDGCTTDEFLVVLNCQSREGLMLKGQYKGSIIDGELVEDALIAGAVYTYADHILAPIGPISISSKTDLGKLEDQAVAEGIEVVPNINDWIRSLRRRDRPDPLCGCKLFYPEMVGEEK